MTVKICYNSNKTTEKTELMKILFKSNHLTKLVKRLSAKTEKKVLYQFC